VTRAFGARSRELVRMLAELARTVPAGTPAADVQSGDAESPAPPCDLVCTSPPYPATYDYFPLQHLRLAWLGALDSLSTQADREIGARRDFRRAPARGYQRWKEATAAWVARAAEAVVAGGHIAVLIGDGIHDRRLFEARGPLVAAARATGLVHVAGATIERIDPATRLAKREHAIVLQKPATP
jgi:hypothetical protein